jgi:hypothetical protein
MVEVGKWAKVGIGGASAKEASRQHTSKVGVKEATTRQQVEIEVVDNGGVSI